MRRRIPARAGVPTGRRRTAWSRPAACGVRSTTLRAPAATSAATCGLAATRPYQLYEPVIGSKCPARVTVDRDGRAVGQQLGRPFVAVVRGHHRRAPRVGRGERQRVVVADGRRRCARATPSSMCQIAWQTVAVKRSRDSAPGWSRRASHQAQLDSTKPTRPCAPGCASSPSRPKNTISACRSTATWSARVTRPRPAPARCADRAGTGSSSGGRRTADDRADRRGDDVARRRFGVEVQVRQDAGDDLLDDLVGDGLAQVVLVAEVAVEHGAADARPRAATCSALAAGPCSSTAATPARTKAARRCGAVLGPAQPAAVAWSLPGRPGGVAPASLPQHVAARAASPERRTCRDIQYPDVSATWCYGLSGDETTKPRRGRGPGGAAD